MIVHNVAIDIDEVFARPELISKGIPCLIFIIKHHWIFNTELLERSRNVYLLVFEGELWRVYADYFETLVFILCIPLVQVWNGALAVDAAVRPEVDKYHFLSFELADGNWLAICVEVSVRRNEFWRLRVLRYLLFRSKGFTEHD